MILIMWEDFFVSFEVESIVFTMFFKNNNYKIMQHPKKIHQQFKVSGYRSIFNIKDTVLKKIALVPTGD